jgi:hypothetical protein
MQKWALSMLKNKKCANTFSRFAKTSESNEIYSNFATIISRKIHIKDISIELLRLQKKTPALRLGFNLSEFNWVAFSTSYLAYHPYRPYHPCRPCRRHHHQQDHGHAYRPLECR